MRYARQASCGESLVRGPCYTAPRVPAMWIPAVRKFRQLPSLPAAASGAAQFQVNLFRSVPPAAAMDYSALHAAADKMGGSSI